MSKAIEISPYVIIIAFIGTGVLGIFGLSTSAFALLLGLGTGMLMRQIVNNLYG